MVIDGNVDVLQYMNFSFCWIASALYSLNSDIFMQWAYGVTRWEIFTGGRIPYSSVKVKDLPVVLREGFRLHKTENAALSTEM